MDLSIVVLCNDSALQIIKTLNQLSLQNGIEQVNIFLLSHNQSDIVNGDFIKEQSVQFPMLNIKVVDTNCSRNDINDKITEETSKSYFLFIGREIDFDDNTNYLRDLMDEIEKSNPHIVTTRLKSSLSKFKSKLGFKLYNSLLWLFSFKHTVIHTDFFLLRVDKSWEVHLPSSYCTDELQRKVDNIKSNNYLIIKNGITFVNDKFIVNIYKHYILGLLKTINKLKFLHGFFQK